MFGFLNIYKPKGMTSHDVIAIVRRKLGIKRVGHSGTLDPFAEGVLIIGLNEATRLFEYLPSDKKYIGEVLFGIETDTDDITGKILREENIDLDVEKITVELKKFQGKIKQKPPIYSAIHINGERAYDLARENKITLDDVQEKEVEIYAIAETCHGKSLQGHIFVQLQIHCSSGTYIRSIARDLGKGLNTCAVLSSLKRTQIGDFCSSEDSLSLESLEKIDLNKHLILPQNLLKLEKIIINKDNENDIFHGRQIKLEKKLNDDTLKTVQLLTSDDKLIAIGFIEDGYIKPKKVFNQL
jgi:tRNA pseudouridine55 synthase